MLNEKKNFDVDPLKERAKELETLYRVDEALTGASLPLTLGEICRILPKGFCNVKACAVIINLDDRQYSPKQLPASPVDEIRSDIVVAGKQRGSIRAVYGEDLRYFVSFLPEEQKLLDTIAHKISGRIFQEELSAAESRSNWEAILLFLQNTDHNMLLHVCEKMLALLAKSDHAHVRDIFREMNWSEQDFRGEINFSRNNMLMDVMLFSSCVFNSAKACFSNTQIFDSINLWIYQEKTHELIKLVDKKATGVKDIFNALNQYLKAVKTTDQASKATKRWLIVELAKRFLTENIRTIESARKYLSVEDFCELLNTIACSPKSSGKIGGKATGYFLANKIIESHISSDSAFANVKMAKTWYIAADELGHFLNENHLDELNEHKYRDILEIRISYPKIVHSIKSGHLSPYILSELHQILDQSWEKPLIIRSSSLLEDQKNTAFSGKYKSLFLTNTGSREERLECLINGILEVYSSMFSPDSIQYRKEHGLLDYSEQMGIMIQEVVGRRIGPYYFPLYAGVGFSYNEFLWSPRLHREDGLLRMVMGLGTRAVDRVGDDFPVLLSPEQPKLRVNNVPQEMQKYSPRMIDVLDMENNCFTTISIQDLVREYGSDIPNLNHTVSLLKEDTLTDYNKFLADMNHDKVIVTFDGLINKTTVISQMKLIMNLLAEKLGYPVDIEFAGDGEHLYILQCRPQSKSKDNVPAAIPSGIITQSIIFTAEKYISNGKVTGIKTVVCVDPDEYDRLEDHRDLVRVGNAISELNRILYRRSFILMGPGRWGSRGDIKLGVRVTYSDISNTAMLIEVSKKKSKHQPDLSFGTHFYQDLVEANIKYLPLYPEDEGIVFQQSFFRNNTNALESLLPAYSDLSHVIKVINISDNYFRKELMVLMNADLGKAIAYLDYPQKLPGRSAAFSDEYDPDSGQKDSDGWKWRHYMAEKISALIDMDAFSVKGIYLFGSTSTCTARLNSDIDLLIHFGGSEQQKQDLSTWLTGWSMALSEMNYLKTGYRSEGLLDVHFVTDNDIENKNSYASKINSLYDPAVVLRVRENQ